TLASQVLDGVDAGVLKHGHAIASRWGPQLSDRLWSPCLGGELVIPLEGVIGLVADARIVGDTGDQRGHATDARVTGHQSNLGPRAGGDCRGQRSDVIIGTGTYNDVAAL